LWRKDPQFQQAVERRLSTSLRESGSYNIYQAFGNIDCVRDLFSSEKPLDLWLLKGLALNFIFGCRAGNLNTPTHPSIDLDRQNDRFSADRLLVEAGPRLCMDGVILI